MVNSVKVRDSSPLSNCLELIHASKLLGRKERRKEGRKGAREARERGRQGGPVGNK